MDRDQNIITDKRGIADVFADFYATLYRSRQDQAESVESETIRDQFIDVPPMTTTELKTHLRKMKTNRAADRSGVVVEML